MDEGLDRLYELPLDEFTAARDALAQELRETGEREAAKEVKALRRPSVAAWAVNRLTRSHRDKVGELVALREELQEAQRAALSGGGAETLREIGERRRGLVDELKDEAEGILTEGGHATARATMDRVEDTLMAATLDEEAAAAVAEGRLTRELAAPSGLEQLAEMAPARPLKARAKDGRARDRARRVEEEARAAEEAAAAAEREARAAEEEAERAAKAAAAARRRAEREAARARELREKADALQG